MRISAVLPYLLGLVVAVPTGSGVEEYPPPDKVKIVDMTYGGTGCPAGSVGSALSAKRDIMTLIFDSYVAESGPGIPVSKNRATCQLNVKLEFPPGWSYTIVQSTFRGFAMLPKGFLGVCKATYYLSGESTGITRSLKLHGPMSDDYTKSDDLGVSSLIWSRCGKEDMLNIKSAIEIHPMGTKEQALMTVDSHDLKVTQLYSIKWQKCPTGNH